MIGALSATRSNIMKRFFTPNLEIKARLLRGFLAAILPVAAIGSFPFSVLLRLRTICSV